MEPKVQANDDGSLTLSITLPPASTELSMLAQEDRLMAAVNAVGRSGARHLPGGFDAEGAPFLAAGRKWTSKGGLPSSLRRRGARCSSSAISISIAAAARHSARWRHARASWAAPRSTSLRAGATPHLARSLAHQYANSNARAVVRDLEENHARKLAPSYVAAVAEAVAEAAGEPVVERNAHAAQSPPRQVASAVLGRDGAQMVLTLRALLLSTSRWTSLWTYLDKHDIPST